MQLTPGEERGDILTTYFSFCQFEVVNNFWVMK